MFDYISFQLIPIVGCKVILYNYIYFPTECKFDLLNCYLIGTMSLSLNHS